MWNRSLKGPSLLALVATLALSTTAGAAELVFEDGAVLPIADGWRVEGERIVFEQLDGTLASLRSDGVRIRVDSPRVKAPASTVEIDQETRRAAIVLRDKDVANAAFTHSGPSPPQATAATTTPRGEAPEQATQPPDAPPSAPPASPVGELTAKNFRMNKTGDGAIVLTGEVVSGRASATSNVEVIALLMDAAGKEVASAPSILSTPTVPANGRARFRAQFADPPQFKSFGFRVIADR